MQSPPVVPSQDERELVESELAGLDCLGEEWQALASRFGALLESERITLSDDFGYIFRYEASRVMEDENGAPYNYRFRLTLWSKDCAEFSVATHSNFKLPAVRSR